LLGFAASAIAAGNGGTGQTVATAPSAFHGSVAEGAFPQPYRGWAAVGGEHSWVAPPAGRTCVALATGPRLEAHQRRRAVWRRRKL